MFKTIFLDTTKFKGAQKIWEYTGTLPPNAPVATGLVCRTKVPFNKSEVYCIVN